jgi:hypothetical protein
MLMSGSPHETYRTVRRSIAAGVLALSATIAPPAMAARPEAAVAALSRLSEPQLDTGSAPGSAFLKQFFPQGCSAPSGPPSPQFEAFCAWSSSAEEADFDLLVGMQDRKVVSVVTEPYALDSKVWECRPLYEKSDEVPSDLQVCSVRSASTANRANWAKSWKTFLSAIN